MLLTAQAREKALATGLFFSRTQDSNILWPKAVNRKTTDRPSTSSARTSRQDISSTASLGGRCVCVTMCGLVTTGGWGKLRLPTSITNLYHSI